MTRHCRENIPWVGLGFANAAAALVLAGAVSDPGGKVVAPPPRPDPASVPATPPSNDELRAAISRPKADDISLADLTRDLAKWESTQTAARYVLWMPVEYFIAASRGAGGTPGTTEAPEKSRARARAMCEQYTTVWIMNGEGPSPDALKYKSREELEADARLLDSRGRVVKPVPFEQVSAPFRQIADRVRAQVQESGGKLGIAGAVIFFPAKDTDGRTVADAKAHGLFSVRVSGQDFHYRTPIDSAVPRQTCPKCGEFLSGTFRFCPYDGERLWARESTPKAGAGAEPGSAKP